jgi:hypothetical protein
MARCLKLGDYLIMGLGEEKEHRGRENQKILSDAFEALLGALWLDSQKDFSLMRNFLLKQLKALGLTDFNQDYEQAAIKMGIQTFADDLTASLMPEIYEAEGGGGRITLAGLINYQKIKRRATKPLTGLAAILEAWSAADSEDEEVEEVKIAITRTDNTQAKTSIPRPIPTLSTPVEKAKSAKKAVLTRMGALTAGGMGVGIAPASANASGASASRRARDVIAAYV